MLWWTVERDDQMVMVPSFLRETFSVECRTQEQKPTRTGDALIQQARRGSKVARRRKGD